MTPSDMFMVGFSYGPQLVGITSPDAAPDPTVTLTILQAFFLGLVQGVTEFLPISSTAHLKVVPVTLGWGDPGVAFTAVIQLGSIVAVIGYFWRDLVQITRGGLRALLTQRHETLEFRMAVGIALGTLPIVIAGLLIKVLIPDFDRSPLRSMEAIALASIVMSLLLAATEKWGSHQRKLKGLTVQDGVSMGLAQALALIPGVSRSGSTLTAGLAIGLQRAAAARFSFLLGIPAITLAGLVELLGLLKDNPAGGNLIVLAVGVISSGIFSYLAIAWLLRYLQTHDTWFFVWYRLIFGSLILVGIATGLLQNI
ncbi:undecaprenyl-diphosphate phosphatase [Trichothermofontia sp.]